MARGGSKPGERRGGRAKGTPNKPNPDAEAMKEIARSYGPQAVRELAKLAGISGDAAGKAESEQARIAALNGILDRGYGKPSQSIGGDPDNPIKLGGKFELVFVDSPKVKS
jgi:hypothetical protein